MTTPFDRFTRNVSFGQVEMTCEANVNGEAFRVRQFVDAYAYDDEMVRSVIEDQLRDALVREILKKYKPAIRVRR